MMTIIIMTVVIFCRDRIHGATGTMADAAYRLVRESSTDGICQPAAPPGHVIRHRYVQQPTLPQYHKKKNRASSLGLAS